MASPANFGRYFGLKNMIVMVLTVMMITITSALYEDQVGQFDWVQRYVGKPLFVEFDHLSQSGKCVIVGTEQNVLASISGRNGQIVWRQVLESGTNGRIDGLLLSDNHIYTLTAGSTVRGWTTSNGYLVWEIMLPTSSTGRGHVILAGKVNSEDSLAVVHEGRLSLVDISDGMVHWTIDLPQSSVYSYDHMTSSKDGIHLAARSSNSVAMVTVNYQGKVVGDFSPTAFAQKDDTCSFISTRHFACVSNGNVIKYTSSASTQVHTLPIPGVSGRARDVTSQAGHEGSSLVDIAIGDDHVTLELKDGRLVLLKVLNRVSVVEFLHNDDGDTMVALSRRSAQDVLLEKYRVENGKVVNDGEQILHLPDHHGQPVKMYGLAYKKRDGGTGHRYLVLSQDHSILLLTQNGKVSWLREEALAGILSVEMVDLPLSETEAKIEDEFGAPDDDILSMFTKRVMTQLSQLQLLMHHVKDHLRGNNQPDTEEHDAEDEVDLDLDLTRDRFNLHKMIVLATQAGKLYGMYSETGSLVWKRYVDGLLPFIGHGEATMPIVLQRSTLHQPHQPQCLVLARDKATDNGHVMTFNPITGDLVESVNLGYRIQQTMPLTHTDDVFLRGILLMDTENQIHVYPSNHADILTRHVADHYLFTADARTQSLHGFNLQKRDQMIVANPTWNVNLEHYDQKITNVVSKRSIEHVHSQGRVLADRNVLYKYLNPNLVVVTAQGSDPSQKSIGFLNVYLVDAVSGNMIFHVNHKRVSGPIQLVHSENWLVYSYWNQKSRRHEMTVIELYEGHKQSNSTVFSSLEPPPLPLVMRQSYIFPTKLTTMGVTVTEKGITSKHLLIGLQVGGVIQLPMAFLDPRRPVDPTAEHREEGILPYMPELPVQFDSMINYNQSLTNIRAIHTAPSGLESTSLVFIYGLDLFNTRVYPSKMFDVLKEDFDYLFISLVLVGMILISIISQKLAARKALKRNWK